MDLPGCTRATDLCLRIPTVSWGRWGNRCRDIAAGGGRRWGLSWPGTSRQRRFLLSSPSATGVCPPAATPIALPSTAEFFMNTPPAFCPIFSVVVFLVESASLLMITSWRLTSAHHVDLLSMHAAELLPAAAASSSALTWRTTDSRRPLE